jgi:uncharacterized protein (TIGR03437 family)
MEPRGIQPATATRVEGFRRAIRPSWMAAALSLCAAGYAHPSRPEARPQKLTAVPKGPIHVERNRLVDSQGRAFLLRGTELPEFRTPSQAGGSEADGFGLHSATVFSTIRQRWNMNVVRIPLSLSDYARDPRYLQSVAEVVRRANELELAVILSAHQTRSSIPSETLTRFWRECSMFLINYPQLIFELDAGDGVETQELIRAVRAGGATQPVLVSGRPESRVEDANAIFLVSPKYATTRVEQDRDGLFGELAERVPVLVSGLDPELDRNSEECASLHDDPSEAEALVRANLEYFDAHDISWVVSEYRPGKLIGDYRNLIATSLENGWTCGHPENTGFGIGEAVQFHLWGGELRGLFAVSVAGNFTIARGSLAIVYGGIFAEHDAANNPTSPTPVLGKVSVRITDSRGVPRKAGLLYVSSGWGQANFVVPPGCALGPARVNVERSDGTTASTPITITDVAPGFWTVTANGLGPVIGVVRHGVPVQTDTPIFECHSGKCSTLPIPISTNSSTAIRLFGAGFRYAACLSDMHVTIAGIPVPVVAFGPSSVAGVDQLTLRIPSSLRDAGEADLLCSIYGRLSNVVRINLGHRDRPL